MTSNLNNVIDWMDGLHEQEGPQDALSTGAPTSDPYGGGGGDTMNAPPSIANPPGEKDPEQQGQDQDILNDPQNPDVDSFSDNSADFEAWRKEYFELSIKGDTNEMLDALGQVRDRELTSPQRRFVEDNMQIVLLRQDANFDKASKEIRKLMNQELDRNNPAVSIMEHINNTLQAHPVLNNIFVKMAGQGSMKGELHRRMMGALLGAVQVGSGGNRQDLMFAARDYSIDISTRFYTDWRNINLGKWMLQEDDPDKILSDAEVERLQEGSPEEKRVHRRRVCLESISAKFADRAYIIHVVEPDNGTVHAFGWDMSDGLRAGYKEGTLVVRKRKSEFRDALIDDNGSIIPVFEYAINYKREEPEVTDTGSPVSEEISFINAWNTGS